MNRNKTFKRFKNKKMQFYVDHVVKKLLLRQQNYSIKQKKSNWYISELMFFYKFSVKLLGKKSNIGVK